MADMINPKSIFVGVILSFLAYFTLMSLGIVLGGGAVQNLFEVNTARSGMFAWSSAAVGILSIVVGLFLGSFICSRLSGTVSSLTNIIQGCVVTALFFAVLSVSVGRMFGSLGAGFQNITGGMASAVQDMASNERLQDTVGQALSDVTFKEGVDTDKVIRGVTVRIVNGDFVGAKNYIARQTGISPFEADRRIERFRFEIESTLRDLSLTAGRGVSLAGWVMFACLSLGTMAATLGAIVGAERNRRRPLSSIPGVEQTTIRRAA